MQVKIVADENINFNIIKRLRTDGFCVYSILENNGGADDETVISIAKQEKAILLTEDSDFGEWVFAHGIKDICVIFMRYRYSEIELITKQLLQLLKNKKYNFENSFFVLTPTKVRIRNI